MAQLEKTRRSSESPRTPRTPTSPTFEQLLRVEDGNWHTSSSPTFGINNNHNDQEEYPMSPSQSHHKKSVLSLVKERAKKLRHSLSGKKKHVTGGSSGGNSPPSWGVTLEDDDDDEDQVLEQEGDPEYLGAPMYESEAAPENLKETARQHPRADPVVSEKHVLSNAIKCQANDEPLSPNKTMTETVTEKLAPAYAAMSGATHNIASKLANLTVTSPRDMSTASPMIHGGSPGPRDMSTASPMIHGGSPVPRDMSTASTKIHGGTPEPRDMSTASAKIHGGTPQPRNMSTASANIHGGTPQPRDMSTASAKIHGGTPEPRDMSTASAKIHGGTPEPQYMSTASAKIHGGTPEPRDMSTASAKIHGGTPEPQYMSTASVKIRDGPQENTRNAARYPVSPPANNNEIMGENMGNVKKFETCSPHKWDKGVSVKEYFMNKLEPGDDEKALSEAITEAISPRRTTAGDTGVVEKVKEAVTSFFWHEESSNSSIEKAAKTSNDVPFSVNLPSFTPHNRFSAVNVPSSNVSKYKTANYCPQIPLSTSAHEVVEEENHGKILQAN